jgi:ankyrin repeat protein
MFKDGSRMNLARSHSVGITVWVALVACNPSLVIRSCNADEPIQVAQKPAEPTTPHGWLRQGDWEKAIQMMEADPKWIGARDDDGCMPLHKAVERGLLPAVEWLLSHGAEVDALSFRNRTPLHLAEDPAVVRLVLEKKPNLWRRNPNGDTAIQYAAYQMSRARGEKKERLRQVLALYKEAVEDPDLITAVMLGDLVRVKEHLARSPELTTDVNNRSPLRTAASLGYYNICRYLLEEHHVDVNDAEQGDGGPVFRVASPILMTAFDYPNIVRLLIEHGADVKSRIAMRWGFRSGPSLFPDENVTILHLAACQAHPQTINLLIEAGADIFALAHDRSDSNPNRARTPLEIAVLSGKTENAAAIVNHLLFELAEPRLRQELLDRSLWWAAGVDEDDVRRKFDRPKLVEMLLKKGADPNASRGNETVLWDVARTYPNVELRKETVEQIVGLLIKYGAKMDLHSAVALGDEKKVRELLPTSGQNINALGPDGLTPLHSAVRRNHKAIVVALLEAGADVNARDGEVTSRDYRYSVNHGETPLDHALSWKRDEIHKLLRQAGGKRSSELTASPE